MVNEMWRMRMERGENISNNQGLITRSRPISSTLHPFLRNSRNRHLFGIRLQPLKEPHILNTNRNASFLREQLYSTKEHLRTCVRTQLFDYIKMALVHKAALADMRLLYGIRIG